MRLCEPLKIQGYWWLPEKQKEKLPGILLISGSGDVTLEVLGLFEGGMSPEASPISRVYGVTDKGKLVTLDNCFYSNQNLNFPGIPKGTLHADLALVGAHFSSEEPLRFSRISFSCEGLDEWLGITGISVTHDWESKGATIQYKPPAKRSYVIKQGLDLSIAFRWTLPSGIGNISEAKITQNSVIQMDVADAVDLDELRAYVYRVNNFLCLALDQPAALTSVVVSSSDLTEEIGDKKRRAEIELYYPSLPHPETPPNIDTHRMLFVYGTIAESLHSVLSAWLENYEQLEPAFNLYFSSTTAKHPYLESRFLFLVQGLETLHRRTSDETVMPEEEFRDIVSRLTEACPESRADWLTTRLAYANELSLRQRLKELIEPFTSYFGTPGEVKGLINDILATRNYLTHFDRSLEGIAKSGAGLWRLCMRIEVLFELQLLKRSGFTDMQIEDIIKGNYRVSQKLRDEV
jgi:hypothetical protein